MQKFAELVNNIDFYKLISESRKVFGPYRRNDNRQIVIIINDDKTRRTVSYPKFLMEEHLGRVLDPNLDTVDHIDRNHDNNDINNLQLLERKEHSALDTRRVKLIDCVCSLCNKKFQRSPRLIRDKSKKGARGIFCSRSCAGRYARKLQLKQIKKFPKQKPIKSEYYRRIKAFINYYFNKYG